MMISVNNIDDVKEYASLLVSEGLSFHPDNDFSDYINIKSGAPSYNKAEVELRNRLMDECFDICDKEGADIYKVMLEVFLEETGL